MSIGGVRHVADIRADDMDKAGQSVIGLQSGSNKGASQSGMSIGGVRWERAKTSGVINENQQ